MVTRATSWQRLHYAQFWPEWKLYKFNTLLLSLHNRLTEDEMYEKKSISGPRPNIDGCGFASRAVTAFAKTPIAVSFGGILEWPGDMSTDS